MSLHLAGRFVRGRADVTIDVSIADREIVAVTGGNGVGKSTLVRVLAGLHRLTDGILTVDDQTWDSPGRGDFVDAEDRSIGVVLQNPALFPHMSARQNAMFGLRARGVERGTAIATANRLLREVGADHLADRRPRQMSGGEVQRVALARALAVQPRVLLLDEPLSAVDEPSRPALMGAIASALSDFGGMALVVAHDTDTVGPVAQRIVHL